VPNSLIASWLATGPPGNGLLGTGERADDLVMKVEVLDGATGDQDDGAEGWRSAAGCAACPRVRSTQKFAEFAGATAGETAHQRDPRQPLPTRGGYEVLHREAGHLHQMTPWWIRRSRPCQLVLVTKLIAVFHASDGRHSGRGGRGRCKRQFCPWINCRMNRNRTLTAEKREHAARIRFPGLFGIRGWAPISR